MIQEPPHELDDPKIQDSARVLADHIASHPVSVVMAAMRLLGWKLDFELVPKEDQ